MAEKRRIQEPPIRIKPTSRKTAARVADDLGVSYIDVIEWAVDALGAYYEHHGKRLLLPLRFNETFSITILTAEKPLVLHEPPHAQSESTRAAARSKKNK